MRNAKYLDYWRKVEARTPVHSAITRLNVGNCKLDLGNFQIISGQNGSGKSSLLKHLATESNGNATIVASVTFEHQVSNLPDKQGNVVQYMSPSWLVEENTRRLVDLQRSGQFDEYIESIESFKFTPDLIEQVNYILNTSFTNIAISELDLAQDISNERDYSQEDAVQPDENSDSISPTDFLEDKALYIDTTSNRSAQPLIRLSHGEQYVILITYLLHTKRGNAILIDEPETYLAPLSQYRLADVLVRFSCQNKLQFILATHSICFIERATPNGTLMLDGAHAGEFTITTGKKVSSYLRRLGYKVPKENIALFEDEAALRLFTNIARNCDADWLSSFELIYLNGESDITEIIKRIKGYRITAVYDGDQRGITKPSDFIQHHVTFLPGNLSPEKELISTLKKNLPDLSRRLDISEIDLSGYLRMVEGIDHHDYFVELSRVMYRDKWKIFDEASQIWIKDNQQDVDQFINELMRS